MSKIEIEDYGKGNRCILLFKEVQLEPKSNQRIISNERLVNWSISLSFWNSARSIVERGLPVFWSHFFILSTFSCWPSRWPRTVFNSVFFTQPTTFNLIASSCVYFRKYTFWTFPKTSKSTDWNEFFVEKCETKIGRNRSSPFLENFRSESTWLNETDTMNQFEKSIRLNSASCEIHLKKNISQLKKVTEISNKTKLSQFLLFAFFLRVRKADDNESEFA